MDKAAGNRRIHLQIITPRGLKFDRWAKMVIFRCIDGNMGILPGHEAISTVLGDGILRIIGEEGAAEEKIAVFGGIATVENNTVKLLTSIAQRPEEIDLARAERDKEQMEQFLQEREDDVEMQGYQVLLRRALVRIEVSAYVEDDEE
ncbi:MAG: ATP synthase F1 subunit epsilon [Candidatus Pelethousia sp.]|nr:ATP synthase F1 subunit epsilon [Candidatus Pelethousia sp.]